MKTFAKKLAVLVLGLAGALSLQAQTTVTGTVKDANGEPLMGAFVLIEGTTLGTSTGLDGDYSIQVPDPAKAVLQFSLIGMKSVSIPVAGQKVIDAVLQDDSTVLDEIVVVGYATVKRRDLLGSVSSVAADKLSEQPVTTVSQALTGKMAGVSVVTTEGNPDADIKIRVRGGGSINTESSPLYIVDGFPVESINDISSSEIASIDVLKDAFSTAIYGSRGANGVVIVTTKSAEKGQKLSVKFNTYAGVKKIANKKAIQVMDSHNFVKFQYELASIRDKVSENYEPFFGSFGDMGLYRGLPTNDWVDAVFGRTGSSFSADLSISGSGENYNWTIGYAHLGDKAIMIGSDYARENLSFKGNYKTSKTTSVDLSVRYARTSVRGGGANSFNDKGSARGNGRLKHAVSYTPIPLANLSIGADDTEEYGDNAPPLQSVKDNDSQRIRTNWNVNGAFNWKIIEGLKLKVEGGLEEYRQGDDRFYGLTTSYVREKATIDYRNMPASQHSEAFRTRYRNTNTLNYDFSKLIGNEDHSLTALIGEEMTITKSNTLQMMNEGFPTFFTSDMAWNYMSSASFATDFRNYYNLDDRLLSFFGRVNYNYKHKYSFGATLRTDGSSKFAKGHRWGFFPSAAVSWTISNEDFMEQARGWLDQLKLRYSFGTAGNNNIPSGQVKKEYASYSSSYISQSLNYYVPVRSDGKNVLNNPDLTWETTYTHNIGVDFSVLQSRVSGSIEVYQNDTRNLLVLFPISGTGYEHQYRNLGSTRNRGVELTLNAPVVQKKDFSLNIGANIAYNRNKVTDIGGLAAIWGVSDWCSEIGNDYIVQKGQPLGNIYGYRTDGRYEVDDFDFVGGKWVLKSGVADDSDVIGSSYLRPGALKLKNIDGSADGKVNASDCEVIGNALPDFTGGFSLSGYFKGFDFSANFNYMIGNDIYNANKIEFTSSRKFYNRNLLATMNTDKRWTNIDWTTGALITDPDALAAANEGTTMWNPAIGNAILTDWAVEDGSFLRLQSVTVGYTLPEKLTQKVHIRKLRVYATGTNLFCLTGYSGFDPEVDTRRSTPLTPGVDYSAYPKSIGVVAGLNVTF